MKDKMKPQNTLNVTLFTAPNFVIRYCLFRRPILPISSSDIAYFVDSTFLGSWLISFTKNFAL